MSVDTSVNEYQVLILANTRELIRQIMQVIEVLIPNTGVTVTFGDKSSQPVKSHILVSSPGFIRGALLTRATKLDLTHLKMIVFDEADAIFNNIGVQEDLNKIINQYLKDNAVKPQYVLFSATIDEQTLSNI